MELSPWTLYWVTRLDSIGTVLGLSAFLALALTALSIAVLCGSADAEDVDGVRAGKWGLAVFSPLCLGLTALTVLTPTTKEACAILVIPAIVNNEDVQEFGGEFVELAREWMRELRPEQEGE